MPQPHAGQMSYKDGSFYDGQWLHNKRHGKGLMINATNGWAYLGEWRDGKKRGQGHAFCLVLTHPEFVGPCVMTRTRLPIAKLVGDLKVLSEKHRRNKKEEEEEEQEEGLGWCDIREVDRAHVESYSGTWRRNRAVGQVVVVRPLLAPMGVCAAPNHRQQITQVK